MTLIHLDVGESASRTILARSVWNRTGILMEEGARYHLRVAATDTWRDADIVTTADGYSSPNLLLRLAEWMRRSPRDQWFALMGALDAKNSTRFHIGTDASVRVLRSGELTCYANDVIAMYRNNSGSVRLEVTKTANSA